MPIFPKHHNACSFHWIPSEDCGDFEQLDLNRLCIQYIFRYECWILKCHLFPAVRECRSDVLGKDYKGTTKVTKTGKKCQRWDKQTPHKHTNNKANLFPDSSLAEASNYCRNPDNEPKGPWCYTQDSSKRWEYCDIKICSGELCHQFETPGVVCV